MIKGIYKPENISNKKLVELTLRESLPYVYISITDRYCSNLVTFNIKTGYITRCKYVNQNFNLSLDDKGRLNYS